MNLACKTSQSGQKHHQLSICVRPAAHAWLQNCLAGEEAQSTHSSSKLLSAPTDTALQRLQTWMTQPGLPLLNLSSDSSSQPMIALSRYYDWGRDTEQDPFVTANESTWYIPVGIGRLGSPSISGDAENAWLEVSDESQVMSGVEDSSAEDFILNAGGSGYYRSAATGKAQLYGDAVVE